MAEFAPPSAEQATPDVSSPAAWRIRDAILAVGLYAAAQLISGIGIGAAALIVGADSSQLVVPSLLASTLLSGGVLAAVVRAHRLGWQDLRLVAVSLRWVWASIGLGLALLVIRQLLVTGLLAVAPSLNFGLDLLEQGLNPSGVANQAAVLALAGFVAPVAEEVLFRGLLFGALRRRWSFWPAALVSSLLFGALHLIPLQAAMAMPLGVALCWARERSRTLTAPIIMHIVNNAVVMTLAFVGLAMMD